jgi:hypothetical protein
MSDQLYFEGDPATDSTRRHLQRVLGSSQPRRWGMALVLAGGGAWGFWRLVRAVRSPRPADSPNASEPPAVPARRPAAPGSPPR